jgi:hypothetical protein
MRHYEGDIILCCVMWCLDFPLSYRQDWAFGQEIHAGSLPLRELDLVVSKKAIGLKLHVRAGTNQFQELW